MRQWRAFRQPRWMDTEAPPTAEVEGEGKVHGAKEVARAPPWTCSGMVMDALGLVLVTGERGGGMRCTVCWQQQWAACLNASQLH